MISGTAGVSIPVSSFGYTGTGVATSASLVNGAAPQASGAKYVVHIGWGKSSGIDGIAEIDCTGADTASTAVTGAPDELTGCVANSANTSTGTVKQKHSKVSVSCVLLSKSAKVRKAFDSAHAVRVRITRGGHLLSVGDAIIRGGKLTANWQTGRRIGTAFQLTIAYPSGAEVKTRLKR